MAFMRSRRDDFPGGGKVRGYQGINNAASLQAKMFWRMANEWVAMHATETLPVCAGMYLAVAETKVIEDSETSRITGDGADSLL